MAGEVVRSAATLVDVSVLTKQQQPSTPILKVKGKPVFLDLQNDGHTKTAVSSNHDVPKVWAVHKLSGEVVSESDPHGRPSLMDRLKRSGVGRNNNNSRQKQQQYHLKPIGRLDMPTEGLILVTNDGGFARAMELPSSELHRVYRVRVHGKLTAYKLDRIRRGGIEYDDDHHHSSTRGAVRYGPMRVAVERPRKGTQHSTNTWVQVTCTEGKNRQIRNVFAALGCECRVCVCVCMKSCVSILKSRNSLTRILILHSDSDKIDSNRVWRLQT
jgi:23S rRNA pseudouridine2605 synthase